MRSTEEVLSDSVCEIRGLWDPAGDLNGVMSRNSWQAAAAVAHNPGPGEGIQATNLQYQFRPALKYVS